MAECPSCRYAQSLDPIHEICICAKADYNNSGTIWMYSLVPCTEWEVDV